jgi:hypothetical protein
VPDSALSRRLRPLLHDLDPLVETTELHCFGGFVIAELYGFDRVTADVDICQVRGAVAGGVAWVR